MTTFKETLSEFKLDLTKLILFFEGGGSFEKCDFDFTPKDFLSFAKKDFLLNTDQGLINGLTNAKRAIDCQIDVIFCIFDIHIRKHEYQLNIFLKELTFQSDLPHKLKIIQALNLAPGFLVAKARTLRNQLEHFYQKPAVSDVQEAIDIADLFISSTKHKLMMVNDIFDLTDKKKFNKEVFLSSNFVTRSYKIVYNKESKKFNIAYNIKNERPIEDRIYLRSREDSYLEIDSSQPEYYGFLKLMLSSDDENECKEALRIILSIIGNPTPKDKVKVEIL